MNNSEAVSSKNSTPYRDFYSVQKTIELIDNSAIIPQQVRHENSNSTGIHDAALNLLIRGDTSSSSTICFTVIGSYNNMLFPINLYKENYEIELFKFSTKEVRKHIDANPNITKFLEECKDDIVKTFGDNIQINFRISEDPDEEDPNKELIGWIQCYDDIDTGLDIYDEFCERWHDRQMELVEFCFHFNIEFKNVI